MHHVSRAVVAVGIAGLIGSGCGGRQAGALEVRDPMVGETPTGADAAVYFEVSASTQDAIVGVECADADHSSLHELEPSQGGGIMWPTDRIELVDGVTLLHPLGTHVMLHDLRRDLIAGDHVELTLAFAHHAPLVVSAEVVPLIDLAELIGDES